MSSRGSGSESVPIDFHVKARRCSPARDRAAQRASFSSDVLSLCHHCGQTTLLQLVELCSIGSCTALWALHSSSILSSFSRSVADLLLCSDPSPADWSELQLWDTRDGIQRSSWSTHHRAHCCVSCLVSSVPAVLCFFQMQLCKLEPRCHDL